MDAYPHLNINVKDESIFTPIVTENLPLHRPIYVMKTEKGPVNTPVWCANMAVAESVFGKKTFDQYDPDYFSRSSVFLNYSFPYNGAFIVRIDSDTMTTAGAILTVTLPTTTNEAYVYNLVALDVSGDGGYWNDDGVWNDSFQWNASTTGYSPNTHPLAVVNMRDPGLYGNSYGFQLFSDRSKVSNFDVENLNNHVYSFAFIKQDEGYDTVSRIQTRHPIYQFEFVTEKDKQDPVTKLYMDYTAAEDRYFGLDFPAPAQVHMFSDNWKVLTDHVVNAFYDTMSEEVKIALDAPTKEKAIVNSRRINVTDMTVLDGDNVALSFGRNNDTDIISVTANDEATTTIDSVANSKPTITVLTNTDNGAGKAVLTLASAVDCEALDTVIVTNMDGTDYTGTHIITAVNTAGTIIEIGGLDYASGSSMGEVTVVSNAVFTVDSAVAIEIGSQLLVTSSVDYNGMEEKWPIFQIS